MSVAKRLPAVASLERLNRTGRGLRIEFVRLSDRYAHRVLAIGYEEVPVLLLESVEASANEDYPSSPVLQTLNMDDFAGNEDTGQQVAMLLGLSNKGHWSLSVQAADDDSATITFDAACRIKKIPDSLGSCYSWNERLQVCDADHIPRFDFGSGICTVNLFDGKSPGLPWVCDRYLRTVMFGAPGDPEQAKLPTTVRWGYRMIVNDG